MTSSEILKVVYDRVQSAIGDEGTVSLADDLGDLLSLLETGPGKFRVALLWDGEDPAGDPTYHAIYNQRIKAVVTVGRGLAVQRGESKTLPKQKLLDRVRFVRDSIRAIALDNSEDSESLFEYQGCGAFIVQGMTFFDSYELRFAYTSADEAPTIF